MRRTVIRGALALVIAAAAACGSPDGESRQTLKVCSTGDYRPFTYRDADGQWSGMDIDLVRDFARSTGADLDLVPTTWPTLMADLGQKCDLAVGGITVTAERAARALFSDPYLRDGKADVMITDGSEIRWQVTQHPQLCGVSTDRPFTDAQKAYLMPKDATALQRRINQWLSAIQGNGSYATVSRTWLGADIGPK